jgi:hypothetical protein
VKTKVAGLSAPISHVWINIITTTTTTITITARWRSPSWCGRPEEGGRGPLCNPFSFGRGCCMAVCSKALKHASGSIDSCCRRGWGLACRYGEPLLNRSTILQSKSVSYPVVSLATTVTRRPPRRPVVSFRRALGRRYCCFWLLVGVTSSSLVAIAVLRHEAY